MLNNGEAASVSAESHSLNSTDLPGLPSTQGDTIANGMNHVGYHHETGQPRQIFCEKW